MLDITNDMNGLIKIDANAASDLWSSKARSRARENLNRGELFEDWIDSRNVYLLNETWEACKFSGASEESEIDVTFFKSKLSDGKFEWEIKNV